MIARVFDQDDQARFARWSGDRNPLHVDANWAAKVYPGEQVVHGMHMVLWLLDAFPQDGCYEKLKVSFVRPVLLEDRVVARVTTDGSKTTISVTVRDKVVARVDLQVAPGASAPVSGVPAAAAALSAPRRRSLDAMTTGRGELAVVEPGSLVAAFPALAGRLGAEGLCGLAGLSTLVGMECPGLWSVFASLEVSFVAEAGPLRYEVSGIDRRFSRVTMVVSGAGLRGQVVASASEDPPPGVPDLLVERVAHDEFAGQSPLIIGGSSGLGATAARLLAAGGAKPVITFHRAADAAQALRHDIERAGGSCELLALDVRDPSAGLTGLVRTGWQGGALHYYASSRIFRRRLETFQADDFRDFIGIYVTAFYEVVRQLQRLRGGAPLAVLYPSSVAVQTMPPDMLEYALAKQAGESVCKALERECPGVTVHIARLPRADTPQTRSFIKVPAARPVDIVLPLLREMKP